MTWSATFSTPPLPDGVFCIAFRLHVKLADETRGLHVSHYQTSFSDRR
jgi:hypothetical protein